MSTVVGIASGVPIVAQRPKENAAAEPAGVEASAQAGVETGALTAPAFAAAREVIRCGQCSLVQFRTATDICRRCSKSLPTLQRPPQEAPAASEKQIAAGPFMEVDDGQPITRAERNRRVAIGARLRACRIKMGLTQIEMAERLEIPRTYLSRIENDRLLPGPLMIAKFASDLGLDVADVLPGFASQLDSDRRWDGISRRIINLFSEMELRHQAMVLETARGMIASEAATPRMPAASATTPSATREECAPKPMAARPNLFAAN